MTTSYAGGCLCGTVRFRVTRVTGPFELCHCSRCRKASGTAFAAMVMVAADGFELTRGHDAIRTFALPVRERPPGYTVHFCSSCGSPTPDPEPVDDGFEIPAGLFDGELPIRPDKHIYCEYGAQWHDIDDRLEQYTSHQIRELRKLSSPAA